MRYCGGLCLRGDDAPDGEEISPCVGVSRQSLEQAFSETRGSKLTPVRPAMTVYEGVPLGSYAPIQGCMVARVAWFRGNRLQVVTAELPENLSCVA